MFKRLSMRLFGNLTEPYIAYFDGLGTSLRGGMIKTTTHEYISMILFMSLIVFIVTLIAGSVFITITISGLTLTDPMIFSYTLTIIVSILLSGGAFFAGYYYPTMKANTIKTQIDRALPFSVFFMATTASSGIQPLDIFKTLSQKGGVMGKISSRIYMDVKALGMNLTDSMTKAANRSPSPSFADLLWGMVSVITTGGSLEKYLNAKTRSFMAQYRLSLNDYAKKIALYTEMYITLVMVGSLFFIILTAIMSPMAGTDVLMLQTLVVFFLTPLVSVAFIVLLKGTSPVE